MTGKQLIGSSEVAGGDASLSAINPADGNELAPAFYEATNEEVDRALTLAAAAAADLRACTGEKLGGLCDTVAEKLESVKKSLLERCGDETGYPGGRLSGEFARTVNQMRLFGKIAREGSWLNARIDHEDPGRKPLPKPDVRSMLRPVGPVVVFGASNFPLALSAAGGDTASALAAGCPVVVKGHPSHPGTCEIAARAIVEAVRECGLPEGTFSMLQGASHATGAALVRHASTAAVGFTGSLRGGRALFDLAAARPAPIPFYAEMGSINPQFVLPGKLASDADGFAEALFGSVTLGNGQFCTNPGIVFIADGTAADAFLAKYKALVEGAAPATMLNGGIQAAFAHGLEQLESIDGVDVTRGLAGDDCGFQVAPAVAVLSLETFQKERAALEDEIFGPSTVVVRCPSAEAFTDVAHGFPGQLASSVHGESDELGAAGDLVTALTEYAGRVVVNGFPTGIEICHAMHHGGPYPAASDAHFTSIGLAAIARWGRPVSFQSCPDPLLPDALKDENPLGIVRLVDGRLTS